MTLRGMVQGMRVSFRSFGFGLCSYGGPGVFDSGGAVSILYGSVADPAGSAAGSDRRVLILLLTGYDTEYQSLMGVVMMVGIVVSNSILIVEFTQRLWADGKPLREAVTLACRVRLRPVLITSLATLIGLLPMALSWAREVKPMRHWPGDYRRTGGLSDLDYVLVPAATCSFMDAATGACRHEEASDPGDSGAGARANSAGSDDGGCGTDGAEESSCD